MTDSKIYYIEGIMITDLPVYLDAKYINYKIIIDSQPPVSGTLNETRLIAPHGINNKNSKVILIVLVQEVELKKITLSIFDTITIKTLSLK